MIAEVVERAKMDDDAVAEIRARVRAAHEAGPEGGQPETGKSEPCAGWSTGRDLRPALNSDPSVRGRAVVNAPARTTPTTSLKIS